MSKECLAIIPARGGSKGIPRKNIRQLTGKPLVAYSIEQALASDYVTRVIVSTDDLEIGKVAKSYGAEIVWRPAEISDDTASSESALLHALDHLATTEAYHPDLIVFLQCTSPLTLAEDIDGTIEALLEQQADTALSVVPFHYYLWKEAPDGSAIGINHDKTVRLPRQKQAPQFLESGAVYVMKTNRFIKAKHRFFGKTVMYVMPAERRWEIDEPVDLAVAQTLLEFGGDRRAAASLPDPLSLLVLDFDGVFTDNKVVVLPDGKEAVVCDRGDGMGLAELKKLGVVVWVLSSEANSVGKTRCDKLGIPCHYDLGLDKASKLLQLLSDHGIDANQVVYLGNDINDLACMELVGFGVAVADAYPEVREQADLVLEHRGGDGAIRELCDLLLNR